MLVCTVIKLNTWHLRLKKSTYLLLTYYVLLSQADIKIWVLTGDKQETAINIGYSTKLLTPQMRVFIVDADTKKGVVKQLADITEQMKM